jgi:hypothetical protein
VTAVKIALNRARKSGRKKWKNPGSKVRKIIPTHPEPNREMRLRDPWAEKSSLWRTVFAFGRLTAEALKRRGV